MRWEKRGVIFNVSGGESWMAHHAQIPVAHVGVESRVRVYFASRDASGRSRIGRFDADAEDPAQDQVVDPEPVLDLGRPGAFDDSGTMPSCLVEVGDEQWLYYIGWTLPPGVRHRTSIGVAVSTDGGSTFTRVQDEPAVGLTESEALGTNSCFAMRESAGWRLWYTSTDGWSEIRGHQEEIYLIKYAESDDGFRWRRGNIACIVPQRATEVNTRPWVVRDGGTYRMWYSYRDIDGFRDDPFHSYRIGYAESSDGVQWQRLDDEAGIGPSPHGWDSMMISYPSIYEEACGTRHLLYNGNGFGATGIGHAVAVD